MNKELKEFLERVIKAELKWMYHYDINDEAFGIQTDRYIWCKNVIDGKISIHDLLQYFTKYYPNDERQFIDRIKELM